jgi:pimeloyl-ACP methyl ester carboxylesterase
MAFKRKEITINGKRDCYWEKNPLEKEVIVLLHGFPGNHLGILDVAKKLDGYRLIVPDLPSCGQSEPIDGHYSLETYSEWLGEFLNSLSINNAIFIGHSFGSRISLVFASKNPNKVKLLVLMTPVVKVEGLIARFVLLENKIAEILPESLKGVWLSSQLYRTIAHIILFKSSGPKRRKVLIDRDTKELKHLHPHVNIELFLDEFYKDSLAPIGKKIKTKSLIIAGDDDEIAPLDLIKELAGQLTDVKFIIMKNSGHALPMERPSATAKIIQNWIGEA